MTQKFSRVALEVSVGYALLAGLWILLSDRFLAQIVTDPVRLAELETYKGWFFVVVTALLLFVILRRELRRAAGEVVRRAEAENALRKSESRFRQVVETIDEVFWIRHPERDEILYVSPGFERIWCRRCEELYASPQLWLDSVVPEDRERVGAAAAREALGDYSEEFRIKRPDGETRWIHARAFPAKGTDGKVGSIVGLAQDITERKKLEQQFLRAQRLESIGTLAGGVAHDLNNILAPILMASSLLKQGKTDPDELKLVGMVETAAQRGAAIIRQLLTFSRGVEGQRTLVQLRHLLKETAGIVRATFPRNVTMHSEAPSDLWPVNADATMLHQVFMNLCVNARDAMPNGGELTLEGENVQLDSSQVAAHTGTVPGPYTVITVADTGEGIPPENMRRIFDPFFTTKSPGKGTGLGLPTVLGIVKSHGGFITVESGPGKGTVFKIHLPASPEIDEESAPSDEAAPVPGHGENVLIVDDETNILETCRHVLEEGNFKVLTAANGEEAISLFLEHRDRVQLVVTDLMMPVMDGIALIQAIRLLDSDVAIVATSGLQEEDRRGQLAGLGVTTVLAKPCSAHALREAVAGALRKTAAEPGTATDWRI